MMEQELSFLKKTLLSLVVSSPTNMTVSRLMKDYRNIVGGTLPVGKYGYKDPIQFLRERCTDIFIVEGTLWDPILTPKVTKNLAHIDKMVQKQKVQSSAKYIGKRRSVFQPSQPIESKPITKNGPQNRFNSPNNYDNKLPVQKHTNSMTKIGDNKSNISDVKPKIIQDVKPKIIQDVKPKIIQDVKPNIIQDTKKEIDYNFRPTENKSYESNGKAYNINHDSNAREIIDSNSVEECGPSNALSKFYKRRLPQYNSDMDFPSLDVENHSKSSAESGRQSSTSSTSKQALLDELKAEIVTLIDDSENGVWCTDLIKLYKEKYGRELRFNRFGHTSIISLMYSMDDRVCISRPRPDGDWLLQAPGRVRPPGPRRALRRPPAACVSAPAADPEDALPGVDFEPDVFPDDCLHYLEGIPEAPLEDLQAGAQLEVLIGEVYSPSHFWMLRVGPQYNLAMEELMDEMTEYYRGAGAERVLSRGAIRVGQYCASLYDNDWHRSLIVSIIDSDTVKVRHVDYGTVETVCVAGLKPLCRVWSSLPAQGIRARLAACRPAAAGWRWPRAACAWLLARVQDHRLYANVLHVDRQEDIVETFLIDTSGEEDVCLTRELIRVGHADRRADSALQSEDCYLYPRFEVLERGATPNYADICRMLADGIALEYVDAYRRHVPGPWTRRPTPAAPPVPPPVPAAVPAPAPAHAPAPAPAAEGLEVRVSEAEWAVLAHLRGADASAARWFALTAAWRSLLPPPPGL